MFALKNPRASAVHIVVGMRTLSPALVCVEGDPVTGWINVLIVGHCAAMVTPPISAINNAKTRFMDRPPHRHRPPPSFELGPAVLKPATSGVVTLHGLS